MQTLKKLSAQGLKAEAKISRNFQYVWLENVSEKELKGLQLLNGTSFKGSYFKNIKFTGCALREADFSNCHFEQVLMNNTDASGALFEKSKIRRCVFKESMLINSVFSEINIGAKQVYRNLSLRSNFTGSLFNDSNLEEFIFRESNLSESVFKNASMRMSGLYECQIQNADFTGALYVTMQMLKEIDITPMRNDKYIGGISQRNSTLLLNLALTNSEFDNLKLQGNIPIRDDVIFKYWVERAIVRYRPNLPLVQRMPARYLPSERKLMKMVLGQDLKVKGLDTLEALG